MSTGALILLLFSALLGGVIGVWQARRQLRARVRARIEAAVEQRLIERYGRSPDSAAPPSDGRGGRT
jgi:uncharacterized protein YneF (UPF0154 family)